MIRRGGWPPPTMLGALAGLAIAACFTKPDAPSELAPVGDGGTIGDGQEFPSSCVQYGFALAPVGSCGGWGVVEEGSGGISGDQLHLTALAASTTSSGRCVSASGAVRRATLDILTTVSSPEFAAATITFYFSINGVRYGGSLTAQGTATIQLNCGSAIGPPMPWYPSQRYLRLTALANRVVLQLSTNGAAWDPVGECTGAAGSARLGLEVQRVGSGSAVTASFESLEICE